MTSLARRGPTVLAIIALAIVLLVIVASCQASRAGAQGSGSTRTPLGVDHGFEISGSATELLRPGASVPIDVRIHNTHRETLSLSDLRVTVSGVDAPHASPERPCTVDDFAIMQLDRTILVDAGASVSLSDLGWPTSRWPQVSMLDTHQNQDGCIDAALRLTFHGTGGLEP